MILWFTVCRIDDLSENRMTYFDVERCHVVVVLTSEGEVVAFDGICPHRSE
ncbi:MAG: Rieske 2Fe-2S domain-containing protein, partial [Thermoplasmata archaeon YP2-bin.285]|nr:Rieske 2Fe-2S domain-containing protein [Candidatus Sysuiplasma superficiale]